MVGDSGIFHHRCAPISYPRVPLFILSYSPRHSRRFPQHFSTAAPSRSTPATCCLCVRSWFACAPYACISPSLRVRCCRAFPRGDVPLSASLYERASLHSCKKVSALKWETNLPGTQYFKKYLVRMTDVLLLAFIQKAEAHQVRHW